MKILVCIKQVPDMESKFKLSPGTLWYDSADLAWRMNEYDEYAVEQAVRLKEQLGSGDITVLSIGPDRIKETMKKALAMGCDRGVHVADDVAWTKDPLAIAGIIAEFARNEDFSCIFTGMQSQDRGSGQIGILLAEMLHLSCVSTIVDFAFTDNEYIVKRELEGGVRALVKVQGPAVFTCQLGLNSPRYPTLPNIMKAKKKELVTIAVAQLEKIAGKQETTRVFFPEKKGGGIILEGDIATLADQLIGILKEKTSVLA